MQLTPFARRKDSGQIGTVATNIFLQTFAKDQLRFGFASGYTQKDGWLRESAIAGATLRRINLPAMDVLSI